MSPLRATLAPLTLRPAPRRLGSFRNLRLCGRRLCHIVRSGRAATLDLRTSPNYRGRIGFVSQISLRACPACRIGFVSQNRAMRPSPRNWVRFADRQYGLLPGNWLRFANRAPNQFVWQNHSARRMSPRFSARRRLKQWRSNRRSDCDMFSRE